jgi:hypothetical protein
MLRTITVVQQVMIELKGAVNKKARAIVITKFVLFIMEQNGQ